MQCGTLDWIVEQKKDITGKTGEIQIKQKEKNNLLYTKKSP